MKLLSPTPHKRINEATGLLLLSLGVATLLSLISYHPQDPSWDTAAAAHPLNLVGYPGSYLADALFQVFGASAFLFPLLTFVMAWKWLRSEALDSGGVKLLGSLLFAASFSTLVSFFPFHLFHGLRQ